MSPINPENVDVPQTLKINRQAVSPPLHSVSFASAFGLFCLCIRSLLPCVLLTRCSLLRLIVVTHVGHVRRVTGQGVVKDNAGAGPVMGGARFSLGRQAPRAENFDPEHLLAEDSKG
jgi:hypothetical protein